MWAVDPEANTLQSLADDRAATRQEYLSNSNILCRFKIPVALPAVILNGQIRHELFLAVKEILHNVVRHSEATEVRISPGGHGDMRSRSQLWTTVAALTLRMPPQRKGTA